MEPGTGTHFGGEISSVLDMLPSGGDSRQFVSDKGKDLEMSCTKELKLWNDFAS